MRPDKIYAPDMPDKSQTVMYLMTETSQKPSKNIVTYLNDPQVYNTWYGFKNDTNKGDTAILYKSFKRIDHKKLNHNIMLKLLTEDFNTTVAELIDGLPQCVNDAPNNAYDTDNQSWSIKIDTTDENKMIEIQTKLIQYISCNDFTIYPSPEGYLIVFNTQKNKDELYDLLYSIPEIRPDIYQMIPIAWETKQ